MSTERVPDTVEFARKLRALAVRMAHRSNASHIGSCLSMADLLAVLYGRILCVDPDDPHWSARDRFILSKGHGAAIYYAALAERGFFSRDWLDSYSTDGSKLAGHVMSHDVPGVEFSTGSLGHGLSVGCGIALAGKRSESLHRVFVLLSDGELDEGSTWEAVMFASHHSLDNLIAIVDYNKIQSFGTTNEVLGLEPLSEKWSAFRWSVLKIDGHDHGQIMAALEKLPFESGKPSVLIADTIKGKGISFMENKLEWHYRSPDQSQVAQAMAELGMIG